MAIDSNFIGPPIHIAGTVTAPAQNSIIAGPILAASIPAGYYDVECQIGFGGTAEATAFANFALTRAGSAIHQRLTCRNAVNTLVTHTFKRMYFNGSQTALIQNLDAGSAGSIYIAQLILIPVL